MEWSAINFKQNPYPGCLTESFLGDVEDSDVICSHEDPDDGCGNLQPHRVSFKDDNSIVTFLTIL